MFVASPEEMVDRGRQYAMTHKKILLTGELGAGKTLFTQGFVEGVGLKMSLVQSPTYTYMHEYEDKVLHIDMYRIDQEQDLIESGILDKIHNYEYVVIEWPKFTDYFIGDDRIHLEILKIDPKTRDINIK